MCYSIVAVVLFFFFFQAEDGIRDAQESRGLGDVYKRQTVYGEDCSPVIPAMIYQLAKIPKFSRECLARGVAVVVVGYPATSLVTGRVRFCVSGAHTKSDLYKCLLIIKEVSEDVGIIFHPEKIRPIPRP
eukprot:TRINITY_DN2836_c0_g1_i1.p1 TRINITY_DN2836_c0_g1~~TRINITY_DN2836_c0_g1_i1.p1  ORF type:complete len:130 (-),score=29.77 TRINITY_DN2836_c0_g1_i1:143-532(-)